MLSRNIDRLRAETDIRTAQVALGAQTDQEGVARMFADLRKEMGKVVEFEEIIADPAKIERSSKAELSRFAKLGDLRTVVYPK